uniref:Uncharacterized protein n=1 Tax=Arion vulgaris TaxID=1028688 RepID=A0A0B6ZY14_9EUPU
MKLVVVFGCHLLLAYLATVGSAGLLGIPNLKVLTSVKGTPSLPGKTIDIKRPQLPGQMIEIPLPPFNKQISISTIIRNLFPRLLDLKRIVLQLLNRQQMKAIISA